MNKTILLVDDEEEIVKFLEKFLKRLKINGIKAISGKQALDLYDKDSVDLVFLDIQLGDMSGLDTLKELKKIDPEVRAIMITGRIENDFREEAGRIGVLDYITKPLDLADLRDKINKYLIK